MDGVLAGGLWCSCGGRTGGGAGWGDWVPNLGIGGFCNSVDKICISKRKAAY